MGIITSTLHRITIKLNSMEFKKMDGTVVNLEDYVKSYLASHPDIQILVGCDSQNKGLSTHYAVVVVLYSEGHGGHVIFRKWRVPRENVRTIRLLNEAWYSVETAELLRKAGLPKPRWIDLDLNPDPKYKSNEAFRQAVGLCEGMGYEIRFKSLGPLVTAVADKSVRS